jgi:hypothetical protein
MVGEVAGISVCLAFWGTKAHLAAKHRIKHRIGGEDRWAWKHGTPGWVTRVMPWLEFLAWVALLGFLAWWACHPTSVLAIFRLSG